MKRTKILLENILVQGVIVSEEPLEFYNGKNSKEHKRYIVDVSSKYNKEVIKKCQEEIEQDQEQVPKDQEMVEVVEKVEVELEEAKKELVQ